MAIVGLAWAPPSVLVIHLRGEEGRGRRKVQFFFVCKWRLFGYGLLFFLGVCNQCCQLPARITTCQFFQQNMPDL